MLQVRSDKRERASYAAAQEKSNSDTEEEEDGEDENLFNGYHIDIAVHREVPED